MKRKQFTRLLLFLSLCSSTLSAQQEQIVKIFGDIDFDNQNEKITVTELSEENDYGKIRLLEIFKIKNNQWQKIAVSKTAILSSEAGGMMGDPFFEEGITIKKGILTIEHNGGSSWKWANTHKYRYQNNRFELIGYATIYGKLCEYWAEFDYNLSTGKITYKKEYEHCDEETGDQTITKTEKETFKKKLKKLPTIENINVYENKIVTPKFKEEITF